MNGHLPNQQNPYSAPTADLTNDEYFEYDTTPFYKASGRIGRVRFLAYYMLLSLCMIPAMMVLGVLMAILLPISPDIATIVGVIMYIGIIIFSLYTAFAPSIRRLNDLNKSGWMSLLYLIPLVNILFWLYLAFARGDEDINDYGAPAEPPSTIMTVLAVILPLLFVAWMGIVMAIALPAYQDYLERSQLQQSQIEQEMINLEQEIQAIQDTQNAESSQ